jgi:hypothetical protein
MVPWFDGEIDDDTGSRAEDEDASGAADLLDRALQQNADIRFERGLCRRSVSAAFNRSIDRPFLIAVHRVTGICKR